MSSVARLSNFQQYAHGYQKVGLLSGWWLAHRSARVRRVARAGLALALGVFLAAWLLRARSQGLLGHDAQALYAWLPLPRPVSNPSPRALASAATLGEDRG